MKRKIQCAVIFLFAMTLAGDGVATHVIAANDNSENTQTVVAENESAFSEEGTTQISVNSQYVEFAVDGLGMIIEEVYVEAGDVVSAGDALYKIDEDSLNTAIAYYAKQVAVAQATLESAQIAYDTGKLEAEYEESEKGLTAETAKAAYDAAMSELEVGVQEKLDSYESAIEDIISYQTQIDNGTYETKYKITEKQGAVDTASATWTAASEAYTQAQNSYNTAKSTFETDLTALQTQIASGVSSEALNALMAQVMTEYTNLQTALTNQTEAQTALETAQSDVEKAQQALESAQKECESEIQQINQKITELTESLENLNAQYEQAKLEAVTKEAEIQNQYDEAVLNGKYAQTEYNETLTTLKTAVEEATETLEELETEQSTLLALEDGVLCASEDGTIAAVNYEAEDMLYSALALVSYYNTETIMISVEVPQEQIARVAVGDAVEVAVTGLREGAVTGTVSSVATSKTTGGSMSNVTYAVVISIDNCEGRLSSGSSATVTFCQEQ